jgi:hypothetical protein
MQTFLPYPDFKQTAQVLDYRRLGKQRVEAYQILRTLSGLSHSWERHPAVVMWRGYEESLITYMNEMITEWVRRGYKNTMPIIQPRDPIIVPHWMGDQEFHSSHRSNLLRKYPEYYNKFGWTEKPDLSYIWPVR